MERMTKAETAIREVLDAHSKNNHERRDELCVQHGVELARALEIALSEIKYIQKERRHPMMSEKDLATHILEEIEKVFE